MKKLLIILLVISLFGGVGVAAFFIKKKKKDSEKSSPKAPILEQKPIEPTTKEKPATSPPVGAKPQIKESIQFDISVPHVDTGNRTFEYAMHYGGIWYKGVFKDGVTKTVQVKKSFGSFVIKQRMLEETPNFTQPDNSSLSAKLQKLRGMKGGSTKDGILYLGTAARRDWVDLLILDKTGKILKQKSINLATGAEIGSAQPPQ